MNLSPLPADQAERDRFILGPDRNISVIAPAGVGKTRSIVGRILHLAERPAPEAADRLARLVVVTYSVRAAREMQQRARAALRAAAVPAGVQRAFAQTFFGTIHSYCVRLLERFGHLLGLRWPVALLEDDEEMWERFLLRGLPPAPAPGEALGRLLQFYPPAQLYALGRKMAPGPAGPVPPTPEIDLGPVLAFRDAALHAATARSIERAQARLAAWHEAWARGGHLPGPPGWPPSDKARGFAEVCEAAFAPLFAWLRDGAAGFGRGVANAYEAFRLAEGVMTYDDQVRLALRALDHPSARAELRRDRLSVLLDEAQDTDPLQFEVLLRVAGLDGEEGQAEGQSLGIVGDFQQAIFAPRSDLERYRKVHDAIVAGARGGTARLRVTFRCDRAILDFVNRHFPAVLDGAGGQSAFVELEPRDGAGEGRVARWTCPPLPEPAPGEKIRNAARFGHEARWLAREIARLGPRGLGASGWAGIAVLCPRTRWLHEIGAALLRENVPVQLHSSRETQATSAARSWLAALVWTAAHPEDVFEVNGVLREIFGVADDALARFTRGEGERLRLDRPVPAGGEPGLLADSLALLRDLGREIAALPVDAAIRRLVERTRLRERLASVEEFRLDDEPAQLEEALDGVFAACAEGATLAELAAGLRRGLGQPRPGGEEIRDAVQLMTCHKAKGLEWGTVIVPFFFRAIEARALPYPRVVPAGAEGEILCRDARDFERLARAGVDRRERQQLQRLLYVTCTRARHHLLLVDDAAVAEDAFRRGGWSFADLLGLRPGDAAGAGWNDLPDSIPPAPATAAAPAAAERPVLPGPLALSAAGVARAQERASAIVRRTTPHALARPVEPPEAEPERDAEQPEAGGKGEGVPGRAQPAILYGTWWHALMEAVPWAGPAEAWEEAFRQALPLSPQPGRSRREWKLFLGSRLARWLARPGRRVHAEWPFLDADGRGGCLEGVVDLAVHAEDEAAWRVIDWKTNRLDRSGPGEGADALAESYRAQIAAYVQVLRDLLGAPVTGSLYFTASGEWRDVA